MNILQINNTDLVGARFNGYNAQVYFNKIGLPTKQLVYDKCSDDVNVISFADSVRTVDVYKKFEEEHSLNSIVFPYANKIMQMREFQEADVVHYHLIHNFILSLLDFPKMVKMKNSVWTLHDPWAFTGHCVYPIDCNKFLAGCKGCEHLERYFPLREDRAHSLWKIKEAVYKELDIDIVVASQWMLDLVKKSPLTQHFRRVHLIPFGVNLDKFITSSQRKSSCRQKLSISNDDFVIFFRADRSQFKGLEYIKRMLKILKIPSNKKIVLLTAGEKYLLEEFREKYSVIDNGWINNEETMSDLYAASDIFLMPSIAEAFGVMAIEAMAASLPVVVFEGTALPSVVHTPDCGIAVPKGDVEEFAKVVTLLFNDENFLKTIGNNARRCAELEYDEDKYYHKLECLYNEVYNRNNILLKSL